MVKYIMIKLIVGNNNMAKPTMAKLEMVFSISKINMMKLIMTKINKVKLAIELIFYG
jgi:hypothetical protein